MFRKVLLTIALTVVIATPSQGAAPLRSGLDLAGFDWSVRPADDLNQFVNGHWLQKTVIPEDRSATGTFDVLFERTEGQLHSIVDRAVANTASADADTQKIAALYASFMDERTIERRGLKPLASTFADISAIKDAHGLARLFARLSNEGVTTPFMVMVHPDQKEARQYILDVAQSGLGLPDRDYYLGDEDTFRHIRGEYEHHIERMLRLTGTKDAVAVAKDIVALETRIAKVQWDRVENRDPVKTYNRTKRAELRQALSEFDWDAFFSALGVQTDVINVSQPGYVHALNDVLAKTSLTSWKQYLRWQVLRSYAPYLSSKLDHEHFAFYGTTLEGTPVQRARWRRGVAVVDQSIGEALGRLYVAEYFPPESKMRVEKLVRNLIAAYGSDIDTLDWMGPQTKQAAHAKLDALLLKIGYPDHWRDYGALMIDRGDLLGNVRRAAQFEIRRNLAKLGQPVDRSEWDMTPPTINAYYNPAYNEIVFPAAILQPPFFDPLADDAVNYGAVGAVIGHEISHGFDDEGSQFDPSGNLKNWWTEADRAAFNAKAHMLVAEYGAFEPVPGFHLNGELTLGENIADNSGLAIAYKAYLRSLEGQTAPLIDGFTGAQRFYLGFAQVWREKARDNVVIELIKSDPHSMGRFRVLGTVRNQPGYYDAFGVHAGDASYEPPEKRVLMW
jgi:predicted metalloendopeptidase